MNDRGPGSTRKRVHSAEIVREIGPNEPPGEAKVAVRAETAAYIAELAANLAGMARTIKLDTLGYLLEMAQLEAEGQVRSMKTPLSRVGSKKNA